MTPYQIKKVALDFDVLPKAALKMRIRYLVDEMAKWPDYAEGLTNEIPYEDVGTILDEINACVKAIAALAEPPNKNEITEEMRNQAKAYPVDKLLSFKYGKIKCINPDHEDKHPTMFFGSRTNRAVCPACHASYDPIEILKILEGLPFAKAVRELCSR